MAAGVDIKASQIIPIIIDPDRANGDVTRTIEILNKYRDVRSKLEFDRNKFFNAEFQTLNSLDVATGEGKEVGSTTAEGFRFGIDGTKEGRFKDFIAFDKLQGANRALLSALFTEENLDAELKAGFKGNPHMGSVVLNRFSESEDFNFFASRFSQNDRVFIVSSIFGGTGAAGFPLLVKNIRSPRTSLRNPEWIKNARLGAITVKPYFGVKQVDDSKINSGTFISKTKAALEYYHSNITGNNSLNALYYLGDTLTLDYNYNEGEMGQKNMAHLIEFLGAMAVIDFMGLEDHSLVTEDSKAINPIYKEYGLNGDVKTVTVKNLGRQTRNRVFKPLTQYTYSYLYWSRNLSSFPSNQPWTKGFDDSFLTSQFFDDDLRQFNRRYEEWLNEMGLNERGLKLFRLDMGHGLLHQVIEGIKHRKKGLFAKERWSFSEFEGYLNSVDGKVRATALPALFMELFYMATEKIFDDRIPNSN
ncbi:MAG: hypothetical protein H6573_25985 [Lewinellaceae bacterium]|nr:hypothetical protein [Lewinellaceae bacterium]